MLRRKSVVPAGTVLHPPFTVTLTDLAPSTAQTQPNGVVGVDGIHGHRIQKSPRLKLDITDATGAEPTYPVLVHLAMGGARPGQIILDPDGNRVACNQASFIWHDRDAQGNLVAANDQFEVGMGTLATYVGVAPDPSNPGQVIPVWGTAELLNLEAQAKVQINGAWADPLIMSYGIHPEPGKPDHFACFDLQNNPCPDVFEYWTGYLLGNVPGDMDHKGVSAMALNDAYFLDDSYGNATFGYTNTSATQPASNVSVQFTDQTTGGPSFNGYTLTTGWTNNPSFPSGTMTSTLKVSYPDDPGGDWSAGSVTKQITYQFDTGTTHVLVQKQNYDARTGTDDGAMPISVSPGAEVAAMPKTPAGDTPRLVLLTLAGSEVPADIPDGTREPSPEDHWVWNLVSGTWSWVQDNSWDVTLEEGGPTAFSLTLVGDSGKPVTDGAFSVYRCPRGDHQTPNQSLTTCALDVVTSQNGAIASLPINPNGAGDGGSRGYLGIELTTAPSNPGTYYVLVESLDKSYRIRRESQFAMGNSADDEYRGAFVICTVMGGEILDKNFQRIQELIVDEPKIVYVRYLLPSETGSQVVVDLQTTDANSATVASVPGVPIGRVGASSVFLSGPVTVQPNLDDTPPGADPAAARAMDLPGTSIRAADGPGRLSATPAAYLAASVATLSGLVYDFRIGTLQSWQEPNVLFGNGQDYVTMSVRITDAQGHPLGGPPLNQGWLVSSITVPDPNEGSVAPNSLTGGGELGRYQFKYVAPGLTPGNNTVKRPHFKFSFSDGTTTWPSTNLQTARPPDKCDFKDSDAERYSHCFGDPNFPLVYSQYDFREMVYYRSATDTAPLTDAAYVDTSMDEAAIQTFLKDPYGDHRDPGSQLANLYFIGDPVAFLPPVDPDGMPAGVYGASSPQSWPGMYFDLNGNGTFEAASDRYVTAPPENTSACIPEDGYQGIPFARVLAMWCSSKGVNPKVLLTHAQKEQTAISGYPGNSVDGLVNPGPPNNPTPPLNKIMGVQPTAPAYRWASVQVAWAAHFSRSYFGRAPSILPVASQAPHDGELLRISWTEGYGGKDNANTGNFWFVNVSPGLDLAASVYLHTRAAHSLFQYTTEVNKGNFEFMKIWAQFGFDH